MEPIVKQSNRKAAFTIVELLTVMSIIVILITLLVPSLNRVRRYARRVRQSAQFHSIDVAIELFQTEFEGYPNSDPNDETGADYCGAMKLCEAMVGQDLLGFHPASLFRDDGLDGNGNDLYPSNPSEDNLRARKGPYLPLENANAYKLQDLYSGTGGFTGERFVLCDVYVRVTHTQTAEKVGMPILYYKADTSNTVHDPNNPDNSENIYDYRDNHELVELGLPWDVGTDHPLFTEPERFYEAARNNDIAIPPGRPYRSDSYILLSAGYDGEYGTADDVYNFGN